MTRRRAWPSPEAFRRRWNNTITTTTTTNDNNDNNDNITTTTTATTTTTTTATSITSIIILLYSPEASPMGLRYYIRVDCHICNIDLTTIITITIIIR